METKLQSPAESWKNYIGMDPFAKVIEFSNKPITPERQVLIDWYFEQREKLKDFEQVSSAVTDEKDWTFKLSADGAQIESIGRRDGNFWKISGRKNKVGNFEWNQPVKESIEIPMRVNLLGKELTIPVFGILIAARDTDGRFLMTVGQETTSDLHKKAMIRLPVQGSQGKLDQIFNKGNEKADPNLERNLRIITGKHDMPPKDLIEFALLNGDFSFPIGPDDTNFEVKHNVSSVWTIKSGNEVHKRLQEGDNKFLTKDQIEFASAAMLTNGHTDRVLRLVEFYDKIRQS